MIRCSRMVSLRMTATEYDRYKLMIHSLAGIHGWTALILKALEEFAATREGPWSTPIEQIAFEERRKAKRHEEQHLGGNGYVLPDDETIEAIKDEKTKAIFKRKKAAQKSKIDRLKKERVKSKAR